MSIVDTDITFGEEGDYVNVQFNRDMAMSASNPLQNVPLPVAVSASMQDGYATFSDGVNRVLTIETGDGVTQKTTVEYDPTKTTKDEVVEAITGVDQDDHKDEKKEGEKGEKGGEGDGFSTPLLIVVCVAVFLAAMIGVIFLVRHFKKGDAPHLLPHHPHHLGTPQTKSPFESKFGVGNRGPRFGFP